MRDIEEKNKGYVYILEVKDIYLPVCKIGMTSRTPQARCSEINNSSTGDFIWDVAHYIAVDDCKKLESLVHTKLSPLRQKRREFFNIQAEDAFKALLSIFDGQSEIKKIEVEELVKIKNKPIAKKKQNKSHHNTDRIAEYAELLQSFSSLLNVKGRPFGQLNKPVFGMSDGNEGIQWNIAIFPDTEMIRLGVNLEGSEKTGKWLIAPFILAEPDIEEIKLSVQNPEDVFIRFTRDAWQGAARLNIVEEFLGKREHSLSEITPRIWDSILKEALTCLDEDKNYRKRKKRQIVTLKSDGRKVEKDLSPHLTIWSHINLDGDVTNAIKEKVDDLQPVYDWVTRISHS